VIIMADTKKGNSAGRSCGRDSRHAQAVFGRDDAPLSRIIAHWFNLPNWHGPIPLADTTADGSQRGWAGRWMIEADGWTIMSRSNIRLGA
jgi:hypothetical protein